MKYRENKIKTILLILTFFIIAFDIFLFFYKKSSPKYLPVNNNKQEEIKKNDDYLINYKIYDNDIPQIKLTIYNKAGVVKIIYPDGQIGEYDNKTELETTFNIQENGEYDFIIFFADGKEVTEKVVVNFLSKVVNSQIEENISNINNDNNEDNNSVINPQTSNDNKQDNNINGNNNNNDNNNNDNNNNDNNNNDNNNNDNNNNNYANFRIIVVMRINYLSEKNEKIVGNIILSYYFFRIMFYNFKSSSNKSLSLFHEVS